MSINYRQKDSTLAGLAVNNWRKFNDFAMFDDTIRHSDNYVVVYTENRDSEVLTRANAIAIEARMKAYYDLTVTDKAGNVAPMLIEANCSHWACGWAKGYGIAVYDTSTESGLSEAFEEWLEIQRELDNYAILDEDLESQMESDEECEFLENEIRFYFHHEDEALVTVGAVLDVIYAQNLPFGYGYYGECWIKSEDLEYAVYLAVLDTYTDMNCSD